MEEEVPDEVWEVWARQMSGIPVGIKEHNRMYEVINRNPKHFQWEHKYASIPKEIHKAYLEESQTITDNPDDFTGRLEPTVSRAAFSLNNPLTEEQFIAMWEEISVVAAERLREKERLELLDKGLWDKHYKPYGLEYRPR
jgi:hypothetical protein